MKSRPIIFSAPMVRAILDDRKTQTRRVVKHIRHPDWGNWYAPGDWIFENEPRHVIERACPFGQPGDELWVRETWAPVDEQGPECCVYRADGQEDMFKWKPSIHMPRWASRITLRVTGVRVERLQEISEVDAKAEGTTPDQVRQFWLFGADEAARARMYRNAAVRPYRSLWESINGPGSWEANPWVWVVAFEHVLETDFGKKEKA